MSSVGIGIVGLGGMGQLHAHNFRSHGAEIQAGADIVEEKRTRFSEEFDVRTYESHETLVEDDDVDAVVVTTPNRFHEAITISALEAGLDVLVEKPLAHTLESAERIAAAEADSEGFCMVGFHNRHAASTSLFEEYNQRGRFGELTHIEANYVRRRGVPGPGSWFTDPGLSGGGALLDIGVHAIDLALYTLDFPEITEVSGVTRTTFGDHGEYADPNGFADGWDTSAETYDVDDSVTAFIRCADGTTISLEAAWATNREPSTDFIVRGTDAGASFEIGDNDLTILETATAGCDHHADTEMSGDPTITGHQEQDRRFLQAVATGIEPTTNTIDEAMTVQRVIDAIYRSSESGRAQPIHDSAAEIDRTSEEITPEHELTPQVD